MGKYALLLTFGLMAAVTMFSVQGMQTKQATAESQADRQKQVLARQIARSVFERGVSELRRDHRNGQTMEIDAIDEKIVEHKGVSFLLQDSDPDGSESVSAMGVLKGSSNADGSVSVTAVGHYEDAKYQIKGDVIRDVNGFAGVGVEGELSSATGNGSNFLVSGRDTDPVDPNADPDHGSGEGFDRPAMRLDDGSSTTLAQDEFSDDQVVGANGQGDIVNEPIEVDLSDLAQEIKDNANVSADNIDDGGSIGSKEDPAIADVDGDLSLTGDTHGIGVLLVDGNFTMKGNAQWEGLIIVQNGDTEVQEGDLTGNTNIYGSLMLQTGGSGGLTIGGSTRLQYSSSALAVLADVLPTMEESVTIRVANRSTEMSGAGS